MSKQSNYRAVQLLCSRCGNAIDPPTEGEPLRRRPPDDMEIFGFPVTWVYFCAACKAKQPKYVLGDLQ